MRFFNTAGPVNCSDHYCLPPLERFDLAEIEMLLAQKKDFVLHAPRQTGKTSSMLALVDHLNAGKNYRALYCNVETAQTAREDVAKSMQNILVELGERAANDLPLVLVIDEIDALVGDSLISVLRQIRSGYPQRPGQFPSSIVLCGVRDVRIHSSSSKEIITGGSAFNVKAESLRMGGFVKTEVGLLLARHTDETGQVFTPDHRLDMDKLMKAFQVFFREHSAHWLERFQYREAGPQLLLQAFLQRILNRDPEVPWEDKIFHRTETCRKIPIHIWGM
jgi:hypothetical protein